MKDESFTDPESTDIKWIRPRNGLTKKGLPSVPHECDGEIVHCIAPEPDGASDDTLTNSKNSEFQGKERRHLEKNAPPAYMQQNIGIGTFMNLIDRLQIRR